MAELKTKKTAVSVSGFLNAVANEQIRKDAKVVAGIMQKVTKAKPSMWATNIVGFGKLTHKYPNGRELDWMTTASSPRKNNITLYVLGDFKECDALLSKLAAARVAATMWLAPLAVIYGLGWAVAWIRRGFAAKEL